MAAGRINVSRRRSYRDCSKKSFDVYKKGNHVVELDQGGDHGVVVHKKGYHSYSNGTNFDFRRNGFSCRYKERELDKLWHGHGPDHYSKLEDGAIPKFQLPPAKKRKYSPIIWDLEDKEGRISSKKKVTCTSVPPPPSRCCHQGLNVVSNEGVAKYPVVESQVMGVELVQDTACLAGRSVGAPVIDTPDILSPSLRQEKNGDYDDEQSQGEEVEFAEARSISISQWASEGDSPRDATLSDDEDMDGETLYRKRSSPESGEFEREVLGRGRLGSSGADGRHGSVDSASRDNYGSKLENDVVDSDEIQYHNAGVNQMESDGDCRLLEEPTAATQGSVDMLHGCRSVFEYENLNEINEGTYGKVYRARDKKTGEIVALKKVKMDVGRDRNLEEYGFPLSTLREINILLSFNHPSIVNVKEVVMGDLDSVFLVMEYMEHDLKELMKVMKQPFSTSEVKCLVLQLLEAVKYLHDNWVLHRDLKTSNLLFNNKGELKVCDFGMSRQYGSPLKPYTSLVVTLWYRAPELLLGAKQYSTAIDMWSVGCIMAELLSKEPLFNGKTEIDQLNKIFKTLGTPNETIWPGLSKLPGSRADFVKHPCNLLRKKFPAISFTGSAVLSDLGYDLLNKLLTYDPEKRITADAALNHGWFNEVPLPKSREFMPTFPPQYAKIR